jgi:hypothetical protein
VIFYLFLVNIIGKENMGYVCFNMSTIFQISMQSVLLMKKIGESGENNLPVLSHTDDLHHSMIYQTNIARGLN